MGPAARRDDLEQLDGPSRWALAALSLGGAFVHFAVMGEHFDVSVPHGVFFAVAAWLQLAFAFAVVMRPSRGVLRAGAIMNLAIIGVWVVSRAFGTPFDPVAWTPEPATFPDVLATVFEVVSVLGCASLLSARTNRRISPVVGLPAVGALAAAVVILSTLSLVPAVAGEIHAHGAAIAAERTHSNEPVTIDGRKVDPETLAAAGVGHGHEAGIESANGTSPCELSGPPVSEGQASGGHGERGPSTQAAITDAPTRVLLGEQRAAARFVALSYPTAADAEKAGYIRITPYVPCIGAHWIKTSIMDDKFDVNAPEMLLYDASGPDGRMIGLSYWVRSGKDSPPVGFAGPNDHWHQHIGLCVGRGGVIGNETTTQAQCERMGGQKTDGKDAWMVHAWVVPGWESAWGLFSGEHPESSASPSLVSHSEEQRTESGELGVRFGLDVAAQRMPFAEVVSARQVADTLGFDGVWGFDHFQPMYGEGPGECFEGNTTLAALSGVTASVRLGLLVTGMTYRHPGVFAGQAITIDHASNGRYELAYGAAWFDKEHEQLGIPFPGLKDRLDAFEEAIQIIRGLLTTDAFTFEGQHFQVRGATLRPRPVQQPHPPIWIGASGEKRTMPITARYADVWHCFGPVEFLGPKSERLSGMAEAAGRDPAEIQRAASLSLEDDFDTTRKNVDAWRDAGFSYLVCGWPPQGRERVEEFAKLFF